MILPQLWDAKSAVLLRLVALVILALQAAVHCPSINVLATTLSAFTWAYLCSTYHPFCRLLALKLPSMADLHWLVNLGTIRFTFLPSSLLFSPFSCNVYWFKFNNARVFQSSSTLPGFFIAWKHNCNCNWFRFCFFCPSEVISFDEYTFLFPFPLLICALTEASKANVLWLVFTHPFILFPRRFLLLDVYTMVSSCFYLFIFPRHKEEPKRKKERIVWV